MSNSATLKDFYQVPNLTFDINKLRSDLEKILKNSKYQTLGITNFAAIPMNQIPGDESSIQGHNVRGIYYTKPDESGKEVVRDKPIDESKYSELTKEFKNTYFEQVYKTLSKKFKLGRVRILFPSIELSSFGIWFNDIAPKCVTPGELNFLALKILSKSSLNLVISKLRSGTS